MEPIKDNWWSRAVNRMNQLRGEGRDTLAYLIAHPGEGPRDDPGARYTHQAWSREATGKLAQHMPGPLQVPVAAATGDLIDKVGLANETLSGAMNWLGGNGFVGEHGFDPEDISANRRGIQDEIKRLYMQRLGQAGR